MSDSSARATPSGQIDFYWDIGSTNTYFAWHLIKPIVARHNATLVLHPFNLGFVFRHHNYALTDEPKAKMQNRLRDLNRWAEFHKLGFRMPKKFPIKTSVALRASLVMRDYKLEFEFLDALFARYWEHNDPSIASLDGLVPLAEKLGVDGKEFAAKVESKPYRDALIAQTQTALDRGVFGAPTFYLDKELYWGKDRMEFIDDHLARQSAGTPTSGTPTSGTPTSGTKGS